jgi:hypothetical protein
MLITLFRPTDEWANKMWYIHTIQYYLPKKKTPEILILAVIWMTLKDIMLSEMNHTENKHQSCAAAYTYNPRIRKAEARGS